MMAHTSAVLDDADAVDLLVTPANVSGSVKQLQALGLWAPACMHTILNLLARCNADANAKSPLACNALLGAYVARSLRSFESTALTFVLPQLVQALRHDQGGQIASLLYDLCQQSALLSHQLMWILNSESKSGGDEGHGKKEAAAAPESKKPEPVAEEPSIARHGFQSQLRGEDTLPATVVSLRDRILASFSGPSRRMFDVEYTFFDKITDISGILKREVRDPLLRKPMIKEALQDLRRKAELDAAKQKWRDEGVVMGLTSNKGKDGEVRQVASVGPSGASHDETVFGYGNPMRSVGHDGVAIVSAPSGSAVEDTASPADPTLAAEKHHSGLCSPLSPFHSPPLSPPLPLPSLSASSSPT